MSVNTTITPGKIFPMTTGGTISGFDNTWFTVTSTGPTSYAFQAPAPPEAMRAVLMADGGLLLETAHGPTMRIDPRLFQDLTTLITMAKLAALAGKGGDDAE